MKKILLVAIAVLTLISCSGSENVTGPTPVVSTTQQAPQLEQVFEFKYIEGNPNLLLRYRVPEIKKLHVVTTSVVDTDEIGPTQDIKERRYHHKCFGVPEEAIASLLKRSPNGNWMQELNLEVTIPACSNGGGNGGGSGGNNPSPNPSPSPTPGEGGGGSPIPPTTPNPPVEPNATLHSTTWADGYMLLVWYECSNCTKAADVAVHTDVPIFYGKMSPGEKKYFNFACTPSGARKDISIEARVYTDTTSKYLSISDYINCN